MLAHNPHAHSTPLKAALTQADVVKNYAQGANVNINTPNGTYDPDDELDITDSEFENDSEFDNDSELDNDSVQENLAVINNNFQQNAHNIQNPAPSTFHMPSATAAGESGYNAVSALMQLSTSLAPNHNMPSQSATATTEQSAAIAALRQLTAAAHAQPAQPNRQAHLQPAQLQQLQQHHQAYMQSVPNQQAYMHALLSHQAHQARLQALQSNGHGNYANGNQVVKNASHQNGRESDDNEDSENEAEKRRVQANKNVQNSSSRMGGRSSNFRPRIQPVRREAGTEFYQMQRREMEETAERPSRMKDMSASLKRLRQSSRSKISQLFHRNKTASDTSANVSSSNNLPDLNDSVTTRSCTQCNQDLDATVELQKLKISEEYQKQVVIRTDNVSIYTNSENQNDLRPMSSSNENSIQSEVFRSNFPDHLLNVRLLKLSIDEVQQIIRQVTLLENVQEKLTELVAKELLSGPVLMSCDLIDLKQLLELNVANWTIFEQLVTGLRDIQKKELLNPGVQKKINLDDGLANDAVKMDHKNVFNGNPNTQWSNLSSELKEPQLMEENIKEEIGKDLSSGQVDVNLSNCRGN